MIPASVPIFCATRWVAREATLKGILAMYGPIMSCLEEIADGDSWWGGGGKMWPSKQQACSPT